VEMLAEFFTPESLKYMVPSPVSVWPLLDDCPDNYKHGKFMVTWGRAVGDKEVPSVVHGGNESSPTRFHCQGAE
jgi:hypothetical protein